MPAKKLTESMSWQQLYEKVAAEAGDTSQGFKEWFMSKETLGFHFGNGVIWNRLYQIHNSVTKKDRDHFIVNAGKEGTGKSTFAMQMACILDPTFEISRVCFTPLQFLLGMQDCKPGQVFVLDEGNQFLSSREAMSSTNKSMLKLFALMRQRNVVVIINVPNFFTLDSYVRDHRVDSLLYIPKRGRFICFKGIAIKMISKEGSRFKNINVKAPAGTFFIGYYNKTIPSLNDVDADSYKSHKSHEFNEFLAEEIEKARADEQGSDFVSVKETSKRLGVSETTVVERIKDGTIKGDKLGGRWLIDRNALEKRDYLARGGSNTYIRDGGGEN